MSRENQTRDTAHLTPRLARCLKAVRWILTWEKVWTLAWPLPAFCLALAALSLLDVPSRLPGWGHTLLLLPLPILCLWIGLRLRRFRLPTATEAERRLEEDAGVTHAPLEALSDRLALGRDDPWAEALWRAEQERLAALSATLSPKPPRPLPDRHDPWGLRFIALALFIVALPSAGDQAGERLARIFSPPLPSWSGPPPLVQLWITPPAYTNAAPIRLDASGGPRTVSVPKGSRVLAEIQGGSGAARLIAGNAVHDFKRIGPESQTLETTLDSDGALSIRQGWTTLADWTLRLIPDHPPKIALFQSPDAEADGRLRLRIVAQDDYGIAKIRAELSRKNSPEAGLTRLDIPLGGASDKKVALQRWIDLTGHPWAGQSVVMTLEAEDDSGQTGRSEPLVVQLPERRFTHPVAQAIARSRKALLAQSRSPLYISAELRILASNPDAFDGNISVFLALIHASARLRVDRSPEAQDSVAALLWDAALAVDEKGGTQARQDIERIAQELQDALARNASAEEIKRLTAELTLALDRLLATSPAPTPGIPGATPDDGQIVTSEDLRNMAEQISALSRAGARDAARRALSELESIINQLDLGAGAPVTAREAGKARQALNGLDSIIREQQALRDDTARSRAPSESGLSRNRPLNLLIAPEPGSDEANDKEPEWSRAPQRVRRQQNLRQKLDQLTKDLGEAGVEQPAKLDKAGQAMDDAVRAMKRNRDDMAEQAQTTALAHLQDGLRDVQSAFMKRFGPGMAGGGRKRDPFGRMGPALGDEGDTKLPGQSEINRTRAVLDELRRRSADPSRPPAERDYLRRLIENFY